MIERRTGAPCDEYAALTTFAFVATESGTGLGA
jgi:hypothetical protein